MLGSACLHATWNLLAKRAKGGNGFLYLFTLLTLAVIPLLYAMLRRRWPLPGPAMPRARPEWS